MILTGVALDLLFPAPLLMDMVQYPVGALLIAMGLGLAIWAFRTFTRAGTNIPTSRPATTVVDWGPYRVSRNPIYSGMVLLLLGVGVMVDGIWTVAMAVPFILTIRQAVIAREERYLEAKFGDPYRAYKRRVRRWI
jgi:protein-S-isoprenylcysteine O-methyltransferase Ste14